MKLINHTGWSSKDLRKFIRQSILEIAYLCPSQIGIKNYLKYLKIKVVHARYNHYTGLATLNRSWIKIRIQPTTHWSYKGKPEINLPKMAHLIQHEALHNFGIKHNQMRGTEWERCCRNFDEKNYQWCKDYKINPTEEKPTADIKQKRYEHAIKMLEEKLRQSKRIATSIRKWKRRILYYEKKLLAANTVKQEDRKKQLTDIGVNIKSVSEKDLETKQKMIDLLILCIKEKKISLRTAADFIGVSKSIISLWKRKEQIPSFRSYKRIKHFLRGINGIVSLQNGINYDYKPETGQVNIQDRRQENPNRIH